MGTVRRKLPARVVVFGERHLRSLLRDSVDDYHDDRSHRGLAKETPTRSPVEARPSPAAVVGALPRVGGLHHRYERRDAAVCAHR